MENRFGKIVQIDLVGQGAFAKVFLWFFIHLRLVRRPRLVDHVLDPAIVERVDHAWFYLQIQKNILSIYSPTINARHHHFEHFQAVHELLKYANKVKVLLDIVLRRPQRCFLHCLRAIFEWFRILCNRLYADDDSKPRSWICRYWACCRRRTEYTSTLRTRNRDGASQYIAQSSCPHQSGVARPASGTSRVVWNRMMTRTMWSDHGSN